MTLFAVISNGTIKVRGLSVKTVAERIAAQYQNGKVILDPRCVQR